MGAQDRLKSIRQSLGYSDDSAGSVSSQPKGNDRLKKIRQELGYESKDQGVLDKIDNYLTSDKTSSPEVSEKITPKPIPAPTPGQPWSDERKENLLTAQKNLLKSTGATIGKGLLRLGDLLGKTSMDPVDRRSEPLSSKGERQRETPTLEPSGHVKPILEKLENYQRQAVEESPDLAEPLVKIAPRRSIYRKPATTTGEKIARAIEKSGIGAAELLEGFTTPQNIALLGTGALGKVAGGTTAASFLPDLAEGTVASGREAIEAAKGPNPEEAFRSGAHGLGSLYFTKKIGEHLIGGKPKSITEKENIPPRSVEPAIPTPPKQEMALLPEKTESALRNERNTIDRNLKQVPQASDFSLNTDSTIPEMVNVEGPRTTKEVLRPIKGDSKKIIIEASPKDPDAFYDFKSKKFVKEIETAPKVFLGNEKAQESTGFVTREEVTPETQKTISYQIEALKNNRTKAVLITDGSIAPNDLPSRFKSFDTDVGTFIYDPMRISKGVIAKKVANGTHGEILGHVEPKSAATTKTVTAVKNGVEAKTSVVSPENIAPQAAELKRQFPDSEIKIGGEELAQNILAQRESGSKIVALATSEYNPIKKETVNLGPVREATAKTVKSATGLDINGYTHEVDNYGLRHALKEHSNDPTPLRPEDFAKIPEIIEAPDHVEMSNKTKGGLKAVIYRKRFNGHTYYVEEIRTGRKTLTLKTMYKTETPKGASYAPEERRAVRPPHKETATPSGESELSIPKLEAPNNTRNNIELLDISKPMELAANLEGETKTRGLSKSIESSAVEKKLSEGFGDLPEYKTINIEDQARRATELLRTDFETAKNIAMGKTQPPPGLMPESVLLAVEQYAQKMGDVNLIRELATSSNLTSEATIMGQRLRIHAERDPYSPVSAILEVVKVREDIAKKRFGKNLDIEKTKISEDIKREVHKNMPKIQDWASFIESIRC